MSFIVVVALVVWFQAVTYCDPQIENSPAVWGDPAPDYSAVVLQSAAQRYLYVLLFVDDKITAHYAYDMIRVKEEVMKLMEEANTYFIQLDLSVVVVDILQTMRSNLSLVMFQEYRNVRLSKLPKHDFAALITMKYAGGLAFVSGMCSELSVMLCGFYPNDPRAMGSIFFHEVAHLVGVSHANSSIYVPNCSCRGKGTEKETGCLRIPGFDHDCTAQQLANVLYKNKCLRTQPMGSTSSLPLCGNGVVEADEQCDCGLEAGCSSWNCNPSTCHYRIHPAFLWLGFFWFISLVALILFLVLRYKGFKLRLPTVSNSEKMLNCFKPPKKGEIFKNISSRSFSSSSSVDSKSSNNNFPSKSVDPNSIVILLDKPPRSAATLHRPKQPPPPPPPKAKLMVEPGPSFYEVPNNKNRRSQVRSEDRDDLSWKFEDFDSDEEVELPQGVMTLSSYRAEPGVPTCPTYPAFSPINRVTVNFHGSGETMETECQSSTGSSSSGLNRTSI